MKHLTNRQKTLLMLALVAILMATALLAFQLGSTRHTAYLYLFHVDASGFSARLEDGQLVYFHYPNASDRFKSFDTLRVTWRAKDQKEETYSFPSPHGGQTQICELQVLRVASARKTLPWLGEPLYG